MSLSAKALAATSALVHMRTPKAGTEGRQFLRIIRAAAPYLSLQTGSYSDSNDSYKLQDAELDLLAALLAEVYEGKTKIFTAGNAEGFFNEGLGELDEFVAEAKAARK